MAEQSVQTVLFPDLFAKPLVAQFDTPQLSSDGGAILLKAIEERLGLTASLAACPPEWRQEGKVEHGLPALGRQRCFGLACGYPDANDAAMGDRGDPENRIKEFHHGLGLDRTSCSSFRDNAFRLLLTAAAYVLLQELRRHLAATACAASQVGTLRERLLKLGTRVTVSARRIVLHLPSAFPWFAVWQAAALALGARGGYPPSPSSCPLGLDPRDTCAWRRPHRGSCPSPLASSVVTSAIAGPLPVLKRLEHLR